ncbi:MAG: histidine kinase [Lachnospiraceae bacterium]|nr:histidine kinase [Lachnospiraceae bacterium]MDE7331739.1 histidine kinase [Lachnospiraceae bacterium]
MNGLRKIFSGYKLNTKFTIICLFFVAIPMIGLSGWLFWLMEQNLVSEKLNAMEYKMGKSYDQIVTNVDSINMSTQFLLSDQSLKEFLTARKRGEEFSTSELMDFYNRDIASLERMVNSNNYLYQVRIYVDDDGIQEMMPILYRMERMKKQDFAEDGELWGWKYNYVDRLFSNYEQFSGDRKILSRLTPVEIYGLGEIGIIEAAMYMDTMFPLVYDSTKDEWSCFVDGEGNYYFAQEEVPARDKLLAREIVEENSGQHTLRTGLMLNEKALKETQVYYKKSEDKRLVVGYQEIKELGGAIISVNDFTADLNNIYRQRAMFIIIGGLVMALLAWAVNSVAKGMLGQFYSILHSIREVQKGDLSVVIENCGRDEMGELGSQINKMLVNIKQLTDDNLNHELLMKNTQIRALQNQINAHFIYNVLESVKMMAEIDEKYEISDAITSLGKLLRYSMKWTNANVTVAEELEYIRNYLSLINLRFDYEIYLSVNMPDSILMQKIPKMSLQPVVENAIYHGIEQMAEDTNIYMKGIVDGEDCIIEITDAGRGMSEAEVEDLYKKINGELEASGGSGNGIGLKNVQDRIKINFGERYGIEIASKLGCYTKIMIRIPMAEKGAALQTGGEK